MTTEQYAQIQQQLDELRKFVEDCQASLHVFDRCTEVMMNRRDEGPTQVDHEISPPL